MYTRGFRFFVAALLLFVALVLPARPAAAHEDHAEIHVLHLVADGPAVGAGDLVLAAMGGSVRVGAVAGGRGHVVYLRGGPVGAVGWYRVCGQP